MALLKLNESQSQPKSHDSGKGVVRANVLLISMGGREEALYGESSGDALHTCMNCQCCKLINKKKIKD